MMRSSALLVAALALASPAIAAQQDRLPGEVVFTRRDDGQANVYRMSLDGTAPILVFKGNDAVNSNALSPHWGSGMGKIFFTAHRDGRWSLFSAERDGSMIAAEPGPSAVDAPSASNELNHDGLSLEAGDVFYTPAGKKRIRLYDYRPYRPQHVIDDWDGGANKVSWGPGRRWVIFSTCGERAFYRAVEPCHLRIVAPDGTGLRDLGPGEDPDWQEASEQR
jgi:hypothetical protein